MISDVFVAIGSNIEPEENIRKALALLREQTEVVAVSSVYRTPPMGYADQADFLNLAVHLRTDLSPADLRYEVLDGIEEALDRVRDPNNKAGPRTIDLDIALWGQAAFAYGHKPWHVPHPDVLAFAHTAIPLAEIAPDMTHPETQQTLATIAGGLPAEGITKQAGGV